MVKFFFEISHSYVLRRANITHTRIAYLLLDGFIGQKQGCKVAQFLPFLRFSLLVRTQLRDDGRVDCVPSGHVQLYWHPNSLKESNRPWHDTGPRAGSPVVNIPNIEQSTGGREWRGRPAALRRRIITPALSIWQKNSCLLSSILNMAIGSRKKFRLALRGDSSCDCLSL